MTAADDADVVAGSAVFTHSAEGADYAGVAVDAVQVTEVEDDAVGVSVSAARVVVGEGTSEGYTLALTSQPAAAVTVSVTRQSGDADLSASPHELTFTPQNWSTPQEVSVSAAADADDRDGTAVFAHARHQHRRQLPRI